MLKNINFYKFVVLSIIGVFLYIVPFTISFGDYENTTILISHFTNFITEYAYNFLIIVIFVSQVVMVIGSTIGVVLKFTNKQFKYQFANDLFITTVMQYCFRILGSLFFVLAYLSTIEISTVEFITSGDTGGTMFGIILTLYCTFFIGIMLMPLITKFGAVEFVGTLVSPFMRKVFNVPGYAAIDATASFVGDGTIGVVVTDQQYQNGYYTQRESALIATTFSIVGISFAGVVAAELGFDKVFAFYYLAIIIITIILAVIISKIPFKKFKDTYYDKPAKAVELEETTKINFKNATALAVESASNKVFLKDAVIEPFKTVISTYITFIPIIMFAGTAGLILATYTHIFEYIAFPFTLLFSVLGFGDDSQIMGASMVVGFIDMYLPVIFASDLSSEFTKFFVGIMTFSQLIFLSETGMMLIKSKIGFNLWDLIKIYLLRTVLSIPFILIITYIYQLIGIIN